VVTQNLNWFWHCASCLTPVFVAQQFSAWGLVR